MNKKAGLIIPLIILAVTITTLAAFEAQRKPDWVHELNTYIAQREKTAVTITVVNSTTARTPWQFTAEMGRPFRNEWPWQIEQLPYPPDELHCVLLQSADANVTPTHQILYIGHHTDGLWRSGWLVHEGQTEPFTNEVMAQLQKVGCTSLLN